MSSNAAAVTPLLRSVPALAISLDAVEYAVDAWQRSVLFLDVLRQRGDQYHEHMQQPIPNVLHYEGEMLCDGRTLPRPVNYGLVRIIPEGIEIDSLKRPFVIVDPRAGHGPGIGGFKADSEIGVAMKAGHPCYFVGFLPNPVPGQTIEDVARAEAAFLDLVIARHPNAEGKPCVIGNCQAGWAVMILAAVRPELFGPIIIAGSPLSYWAGVRGKNPMRYSGGLLGGSWLTALTGDLGAGIFDGALLVQNFENQNPANTVWTKQYNLYSKIDTEAERYLGFETYWGSHVLLNAEEMQFIVDELFIGNKLAAGEIRTSDGTAVDLRNIHSPVLVFCSRGDNITPPQQALDWILDLYDSVDEIRQNGQTIVYCIHEAVGHLGIFVSGNVARKEHDKFASNIDLIDLLPPGLYEAVLESKDDAVENLELAGGEWIMRCETRTLDDIRALGANDLEDERRFAAAAKVSEINLALYRSFLQPWVRAVSTPQMADALRRVHPLRLQSELFRSSNPFMGWVAAVAQEVRKQRKPVSTDNPFLAAQEKSSKQIVDVLDHTRVTSEKAAEELFLTVYGSSPLQSALGIDATSLRYPRKPAKSLLQRELVEKRICELRAAMSEGGLVEALTRALLYVASGRGSADERGFEAMRRIRAGHELTRKLTLTDFKSLARDQAFMMIIDEEAALAAIPGLLPESLDERRNAFAMLRTVVEAPGSLSEEGASRLQRVAALFGVDSHRGVALEPSQEQIEARPPEKRSVTHRDGARPETAPRARHDNTSEA